MSNVPMDSTGAYPARIDTNHKTVQAQVFTKAGFVDISDSAHATFAKPANAPANWQPSMVQIRMKDGRVLSVHHEVALQRVLQGVATLV